MTHTSVTSVICHNAELEAQAQQAAERLQVPLNDRGQSLYSLVFDTEGVSLQANEQGRHGLIMVDFCAGSVAHRRAHGGGKGQMIAKAVGINRHFRPHILDATAGLGKDAFVLACLGCELTLMERSPVAYALLADGLRRATAFAEEHDRQLLEILRRMTLRDGDSRNYLQTQQGKVADVIYLDPMFPERHKQAAVKKDMQAFHTVIGRDEDAQDLCAAAMERAIYRTVVKRPRLAPGLLPRAANLTLEGKSSRYDIYTFKGVPKS